MLVNATSLVGLELGASSSINSFSTFFVYFRSSGFSRYSTRLRFRFNIFNLYVTHSGGWRRTFQKIYKNLTKRRFDF